ncbi:MAG: hypothetical protein HKO57_08090, partial [Akkermansiaceae bacterium]|nr:hypothetical protein [Akkermansiaceae bacterium]
MASRESKWRLRDVVDFEVLLRAGNEGGRAAAGATAHREEIRAVLEKAGPRSEGERRRIGLRAWLDANRGRDEDRAGSRVVAGVGLAGLVLGVLAFLAGVGLMRGLLVETEAAGKAYHLWVFLAVTLGLQWLALLGGVLGYVLVRRRSGALSLLERLAASLSR